MHEANPLKRQTLPCPAFWKIGCHRPEPLPDGTRSFHEPEMEKHKGIDKLVNRPLLALTERQEHLDEPALLQFAQPSRQLAGIADLRGLRKLLARQSARRLPERGNKPEIRLWPPKHRLEQTPELRDQVAIRREIQPIQILRERETLVEQAPVIRYAAKNHVGLDEFPSAHDNSLFPDIRLAVMQRKRLEADGSRRAVEESAFVAQHLLRHPGRCAPADDEHDVLPRRTPPVPEVFKRTQKR